MNAGETDYRDKNTRYGIMAKELDLTFKLTTAFTIIMLLLVAVAIILNVKTANDPHVYTLEGMALFAAFIVFVLEGHIMHLRANEGTESQSRRHVALTHEYRRLVRFDKNALKHIKVHHHA